MRFAISGAIRRALVAVALAAVSAMYVQPLLGGELILRVEEPTSGSVMTGISNIRGWAVGSAGIERVELYIDGEYKTDVPLGGSRKDVGDAFPEFPDSDNSGYSMANNYSLKTAGPHVITIKAFDTDGAAEEIDVPYTVARFEESFIKDPADVSILALTDILINGSNSLTLKGVDVLGVKQDIQLDWQTPKQNFSISGIQPSAEGTGALLDGRYTLARMTVWFGGVPDLPPDLVLDTEAKLITVEGMKFRFTASGTMDINGSAMFTSLKATIDIDGMSETIEEEGDATLLSDNGYALDYRDSYSDIITAVLLQRGTRLVWMENFYDPSDNSSGSIVLQWKKIADTASADTATQQLEQPVSSDGAGMAYPSLESAILQSVINLMRDAGP